MEYKILSHTSKTELSRLVTSSLKDGWTPQGGVSITVNSSNDIAFAQAILKM